MLFFLSVSSKHSFCVLAQFLDKVEVEMRTCEEPRPPNGPSPIAITAGQRCVDLQTFSLTLGEHPVCLWWHFLFAASMASRRRWWRGCPSGSTPSPSRCRLVPFMPPLSCGSSRETASTLNGSAVTSATPASPTPREERCVPFQPPRPGVFEHSFSETDTWTTWIIYCGCWLFRC